MKILEKYQESVVKADFPAIKKKLVAKYHQADKFVDFLIVQAKASLSTPVPKGMLLFGNGGYGKSTITREFFREINRELFESWMGGAPMQFSPSTSTHDVFGGLRVPRQGEILQAHLQGSFLTGVMVIGEEVLDAPFDVLMALKDALANTERSICLADTCIPVNLALYAMCTNVSPDAWVEDVKMVQSSAYAGAQAFVQRFAGFKVEWESHTSEDYQKGLRKMGVPESDHLFAFTEALGWLASRGAVLSPREAHQQLWAQYLECGPKAFGYSNTLMSHQGLMGELEDYVETRIEHKVHIIEIRKIHEIMQKLAKSKPDQWQNEHCVGYLKVLGELESRLSVCRINAHTTSDVYEQYETANNLRREFLAIVVKKLEKSGELQARKLWEQLN